MPVDRAGGAAETAFRVTSRGESQSEPRTDSCDPRAGGDARPGSGAGGGCAAGRPDQPGRRSGRRQDAVREGFRGGARDDPRRITIRANHRSYARYVEAVPIELVLAAPAEASL